MAEVIKMPKMSDTMTEGVIASWLKKVGDEVKSGDILAEVETDKATMELEAYEDGTLLYIGIKEGEAAPVDGVIAVVGAKGEDYQPSLAAATSASPAEEPAQSTEDKAEAAPAAIQEIIDTSSINATVLRMPKMSDTMTEGTIAQWLKKEGEQIKSGDILAEVETDKATMELESYDDGILLYVGPKKGESVAVDGVLAIVGEKGADFAALLKAESSTAPQAETAAPAIAGSPAPVVTPDVAEAKQVTTSITSDNGRLRISPLAKKMAVELGYELSQIKGTGDNGRIIKRDVVAHTPAAAPVSSPVAAAGESTPPIALPAVVGEEAFEEVPVSQMRKIIAKRLAESKFTSPHFYLTMEINMDKAIEARKSLNEISPVKISFNDLIVKAVAASLRQHPKVNSSWLEDKIRYNKHIHIGIAVAVDEGLLVPVVRFADNKSLSHISAEVKDLAARAVNKQLQPQDWEGNTFTISNLGMFGIEEFTAIINPPDACILAIGGIKETAVVKNGELVPGNIMKVTLSCDHRVVDGALGAAFLQTLKGLLEDPVRILI